jgi:hypothetical protein
MKGFCLIKPVAQEFLKRLKSGDISPEKLNAMESAERRKFFESFMNATDAKETNILFEKKVLLKNQERGLIRWAEQLTGVTNKQREAIVEKIQKTQAERLKRTFNPEDEETFLNDLVDSRLGIGVTEEESKVIFELSSKIQEGQELFQKNSVKERLSEIVGELSGRQKEVVDELLFKLEGRDAAKKINSETLSKIKRYIAGENPSEESVKGVNKLVDDIVSSRKNAEKYGAARVALDDYVGDIKLGIKEPMGLNVRSVGRAIVDIAGYTKSMLASIDNSFIGRQGIKTLYTWHPVVWGKTFVKSFELLAKSIGGQEALKGLRASIYARPNSMNGNYERMKLAVGMAEEAFPTILPEKIPVFGRLFKASQEAFTGSAYYMRAELADAMINKAVKQGVDLEDKVAAESLGILINSLTGRGTEGLGKLGTKTNAILFSPKFLQSNIDTLTAHVYSSKVTGRDKLEAAKNLGKIVASVGATLYIAEQLKPGSVEWDPRSSDFGKIKIGDTKFDVTGGMSSLVTLAARLGGGVKSTTTGEISGPLDFNGKGPSELIAGFTENKLSPLFGTLVDVLSKEDFNGDPYTVEALKENPTDVVWRLFKNNFIPIPLSNAPKNFETFDTGTALGVTLIDALGIATNTYSFNVNWDRNPGVELQAFKDKVGKDKFKEVNDEFARSVNDQLMKLRMDDRFRSMDSAQKKATIERLKELEKDKLFKKNNFTYKRAVNKEATSERNDILKDYGYKVK